MAEITLRNTTEFEFVDISSEKYREYIGADGRVWYRIENPQWIAVSRPGGHRILDGQGVSHYVLPEAYFAIRWEVHEDEPHFVE